MTEIDNCLRQIAKVRSVAREEEVAYVARSRLGRLELSVARLVGKISRGPVLDRPRRLTFPKNASDEVRTLVKLCNRLSDTTKTLVQPSEPLDKRWQAGWSELMDNLDIIEQHLQVMKARMQTTDWK